MPLALQILIWIVTIYATGYVLAFAWLISHPDTWPKKNPLQWCLIAGLLWPGIVLGWLQ